MSSRKQGDNDDGEEAIYVGLWRLWTMLGSRRPPPIKKVWDSHRKESREGDQQIIPYYSQRNHLLSSPPMGWSSWCLQDPLVGMAAEWAIQEVRWVQPLLAVFDFFHLKLLWNPSSFKFQEVFKGGYIFLGIFIVFFKDFFLFFSLEQLSLLFGALWS